MGTSGTRTGLDKGYDRARKEGQGIVSGANNPAANTHVGLDMPDVGGFIKKVGKAIGFTNPFKPSGRTNSSGSTTSPTTHKDR